MTGLDVEAARKVLLDSLPPNNPKWRIWVDGVLERLAPCVTEDPQGIDRDALVALLMEQWTAEPHETADRVLALVRPVEGVTLTPEEKAMIIDVLRDISDMDERMARIRPSRQQEIDKRRTLANHLEREGQ